MNKNNLRKVFGSFALFSGIIVSIQLYCLSPVNLSFLGILIRLIPGLFLLFAGVIILIFKRSKIGNKNLI